jgi:hypothetical protein
VKGSTTANATKRGAREWERGCFEIWALDDTLTGDPPHSVEGILFSKLSLSPDQTEAIENLSRARVEELVHGPIAETVARVQPPSELAASGERDGVVEKEYK